MTCVACDSSCKTCSGSTTTSCLSCASGFFLISGSCLPCDFSCLTCSGSSTFCTSCANYLLQNKCVASCTEGLYVKIIGGINTCDFCDSTCLTCSTNSFNCLTCSTTKYLSSSKCLDCNFTCKSCTGTSNFCTSCPLPS